MERSGYSGYLNVAVKVSVSKSDNQTVPGKALISKFHDNKALKSRPIGDVIAA